VVTYNLHYIFLGSTSSTSQYHLHLHDNRRYVNKTVYAGDLPQG